MRRALLAAAAVAGALVCVAGGAACSGSATGGSASPSGGSAAGRATGDPVCTSDAECPAGRVCVDTHCLEAGAWAAGAVVDRRAKVARLRAAALEAGKVLVAAVGGAAEAAQAALDADGALAWKPGHAWRPGVPPPAAYKGTRFEFAGDMDLSGETPVLDPRTRPATDVAPLLHDLDDLDARLVPLAVAPADLKKNIDTHDARLRAHEWAVEGLMHPPLLMRGFYRDERLVAAPKYPGCKEPPLRRTYAGYLYSPREARVILRVTVRADSAATVNFLPERPCGATIKAATAPAMLHVLTPKLRELTEGKPLPDDPARYEALAF